jgi:hypothetical protein
MKAVKGYVNSKPGIQVGTKWEGKITKKADGSFEFDEDGINFLKQLGIEWVMVNDHLIDMVGGHYTCEAAFTSYLQGAVGAIQNH